MCCQIVVICRVHVHACERHGTGAACVAARRWNACSVRALVCDIARLCCQRRPRRRVRVRTCVACVCACSWQRIQGRAGHGLPCRRRRVVAAAGAAYPRDISETLRPACFSCRRKRSRGAAEIFGRRGRRSSGVRLVSRASAAFACSGRQASAGAGLDWQ